MRKYWRDRRGFTLTEMLMAVAVLSLLGLTVIQVFITAGSLNHKAADMDQAVARSQTVVESLKALRADRPLDTQTLGQLFPGAVAVVNADGLRGTLEQRYAPDWKPVTSGDAAEEGFVLRAELRAGTEDNGGLTLMTVRVSRIGRYFHQQDPAPLLFEMEAAVPQRLKGGSL